jgi:hypothetical protein
MCIGEVRRQKEKCLELILTKSKLVLPGWFPPIERQLAQARRYFSLSHGCQSGLFDSQFPTYIPDLEQNTPTEIPLLAIFLSRKGKVSAMERTFMEHARVLGLSYWANLAIDFQYMQLVSGIDHEPGAFWGMFDYAANMQPGGVYGRRVLDLQRAGDAESLAASPVLSACALLPELVAVMGKDCPYPNLPGYQSNYQGDNQRVPYLRHRPGDKRKELLVDLEWAGDYNHRRSSPRFRECKY